jgi:hypothetical protein
LYFCTTTATIGHALHKSALEWARLGHFCLAKAGPLPRSQVQKVLAITSILRCGTLSLLIVVLMYNNSKDRPRLWQMRAGGVPFGHFCLPKAGPSPQSRAQKALAITIISRCGTLSLLIVVDMYNNSKDKPRSALEWAHLGRFCLAKAGPLPQSPAQQKSLATTNFSQGGTISLLIVVLLYNNSKDRPRFAQKRAGMGPP